jgi:glucose-1-phosphate cytidylyltransferase
MKAVILAGGFGTRISEESHLKPKPLVEIGTKPILWHIMKIYSAHGINDFIICCGYKGNMIKEYFSNYFMYSSDVSFDFKENEMQFHKKRCEPWKVTLVDTGEETMTGGRIQRISDYIKDESHFCVTYGDGVGNINISESINFHKAHKKIATLTSTYPSGRFGALDIKDRKVCQFKEKPRGDGAKINGGFFVFSKNILNYIDGDNVILEQEPLQTLAHEGQLMAFEHEGFWQPMDTMRDKNMLDQIWDSGEVPWKIWN